MTLNADVLDLLAKWESDGRSASPEEICQNSPHLLPELQRCIARLSSIDRLLAPPDPDEPEFPSIAGYTIEKPIGRGGMGIVWRAVQLSTKRTVALKVISAGEFATPRARVRFEREVELASRLNHPNIARVYDSGLHTGLFYYAMELVDGVPLDRFVESKRLTRRQILELMQYICAAVHHAHQLGVIHRDLKPSNILVDASGLPHLLDFGLAKEIWANTSPQITLDEAPGTPAYMSPEQASGQYQRVGTASDVYTLGVILYLMLLKRYPHDVAGTSIAVMQRIATTEPARPRAMDSSFPRDLEAIVLKALAREPEQRYASADALARDLARWLDGLPCAPLGRRYFAAKFIRRHKYKLAIAAAMIAVVLGVTIVAYVNIAHQRDRAETEAQISKAVNEFLLNMLASADPEAAGEPVPTLPALLDRASVRIDDAFANQPLVEAAIRSTIGRTYVLLAFAWKGEPHLRRAYDLRAKHLGTNHPDTLASVGELAMGLYNDDRHVEAEELLRPAIDAARKSPGIEDDRTLALLNHLGATLYYQMQYRETEELAREIHQTTLRVHGPDDLRTIIAAEDLSTALMSVGKYEEAKQLINDAMARCPSDPKVRLPRLCHVLLRLGGLHSAQGNLPAAEDAFARCVAARIELYGQNHNMVAYSKQKLAQVKERLGKFAEAEQLLLDAVRIDASERPDSTAVVETYMATARLYHMMGKEDAANEFVERARRVVEARFQSPDPKCIYAYGNGLVRMGMHQQAADYLTRAVQIATPKLRPDHAGLKRIAELLETARAASTQPATQPTTSSAP